MNRKKYSLHIISDATGGLASHVINAILTQFPTLKFEQHYHTFIDSDQKVYKIIDQLQTDYEIVFYALVNPYHKSLIALSCEKKEIPSYDLTGSLVQFLTDHTKVKPINELSRLHQTHPGYYKRIEAMEFTAQHDDSRRLESIHRAEIVIIGLSRVSKSPTSTYLGSMGYRVSNVSITQQAGFAKELKKVKDKIIAFTLAPKTLYEIRLRRFKGFKKKFDELGADHIDYYDLRSIVEEVVWAQEQYKKREYPILDITGLTVEEISANVLKIKKIKRKNLL